MMPLFMKHCLPMKPWLTLTSLALLSVTSPAAQAFDLLEAWQAAQAHDARFAAASYARDAGQEQTVQGRANLLPQVSINGQAGKAFNKEPDRHNSRTQGWGVQVSQPLFDMNKWHRYKQGQINTDLANEEYLLASQSLLLNVSQAYFNVLLAQDQLRATLATKAAYLKQLEQAKAMFNVGSATIVDTYEAQAGFDAASAQEIAAKTTLKMAQARLTQLTGLPANTIQKIDGERVSLVTNQLPFETWLDTAINHSNQLKIKALAVQTATENLGISQSERLPVATLNGDYQDSYNRISGDEKRTTRGSSVGIKISMPLFSGGAINSQVREAKAKELEAKAELEAATRDLTEEVRQNFLNVTNGQAQLIAQENLVKSAKAKLDATTLGKSVGVRSNLDLVLAEQAYSDAIQQRANARYTYLQAHLTLAQSTGLFNENLETLETINQLIIAETDSFEPS